MMLASAIPRQGLLLTNSNLRWAAGGWIFFIVENVVLSENRAFLIEQFGDAEYHGLYGTLSTAACASIAYAYFYRLPAMAVASKAPSVLSIATSWTLLSTGMIMASQAAPTLRNPFEMRSESSHQMNKESGSNDSSNEDVTTDNPSWQLRVRCPFDFVDNSSRITKSLEDPRGLDRISRHPGLWSFGLIGLGHALLLLPHPAATAHRLWWCGPAAVAWIGGSHTDSRYRRRMGGSLPPEQDAVTSNVPFWAMISGQQGTHAFQSLLQEIKPLNALLATGVATWWVLSTLRRQRAATMLLQSVRK